MINLKEDARRNPLQNLLLIFLIFVVMATVPTSSLLKLIVSNGSLDYFSVYITRFVFSAIFVFFVIAFGFKKILVGKISFKTLLIALPMLLIAVNNFPFYAVFAKDAIFVKAIKFPLQYILVALSIAIAEELAFRGLILPLVAIKFSEKPCRFKVIKVIIFSSLAFSLVHLLNLFSGASIGLVLMQLGYSFLLGAGLCFLTIKSGNLILSVLVHFIYNLGGLLPQYGLLLGRIWGVGQIILTAVVAVSLGIIIVVMVFSVKEDELSAILPNFEEKSL